MDQHQVPEHIFKPGQIGTMTVKNRLVMAPMGTNFASDTGNVSQTLIDYHVERAKGGVGLILVEYACVDGPLGRGASNQLHIDSDRLIPGHQQLVESVHYFGAKIALQLSFAGRRANPKNMGGLDPVAPSPLPMTPTSPMPRALTTQEVGALVEKYAAAAARARAAGYDAVEIHGCHGYLPMQFLSPNVNTRTDQYGGSFENRARFSIEVVTGVRQSVGRDFPVIFRLTAYEARRDGFTLSDATEYAQRLVAAGVDALHVTTGGDEEDGISQNVCPMAAAEGWRIPYASAIKEKVSVPVIAVGVIRSPAVAEKALVTGAADFVALGRALLADPEWPQKVARGQVDEIRKCCSCNHCVTNLVSGRAVRCSVNFALGREKALTDVAPAPVRRAVMVIGGGASGMEAARVAALRGHRVSLYERDVELGGQLNIAAVPPGKEKMRWVREYLVTRMAKQGIDVHLGTEVNIDTIRGTNPQAIVLASGARPLLPDIPGIDQAEVHTAFDVLSGKVGNLAHAMVVVLGGRQTGCEVALHLARSGASVTIVSRSPASELAQGLEDCNRNQLLAHLRQSAVQVIDGCEARRIASGRLLVSRIEWGEHWLEADAVVVARGVVSNVELVGKLERAGIEFHVIGDAVAPRNVASAIHEANIVARRI